MDIDTIYDEYARNHPKIATIILDIHNGMFLSAIIKNETIHSSLDRSPTAKETEEQLSSFNEEYVGLPSVQPKTNMLEALKQCGGYTLAAKEINIQYVLYSSRKNDVFPAWIIYMRGLPPWTASNLSPIYARTNMRCVINSNTGVLHLQINRPYPQLDQDTVGN